jgi:hypothetical protein
MVNYPLTLNFPTEKDRDLFLGWLSDGGGEYQYMEYTDTAVTQFDYSKAFVAWGYNSKVDGAPVVNLLSDESEN